MELKADDTIPSFAATMAPTLSLLTLRIHVVSLGDDALAYGLKPLFCGRTSLLWDEVRGRFVSFYFFRTVLIFTVCIFVRQDGMKISGKIILFQKQAQIRVN